MTKVYILSILLCLSVLFTAAQFDKGQKVIGGSATLSISNSENSYGNTNTSKQVVAAFRPSVAWFTKPNQLCGFGVQYSFLQSNISSNNNSIVPVRHHSHFLGLSILSQRFFPLAARFYFTVNTAGSVTYNFGKSTFQSASTEVRNNRGYSINAGLSPGLTYRLTPRILFDASLTYLLSADYTHAETSASNLPAGQKSYNNTFGISSSLSNTTLGGVGLGFRWLLKKG